MRVLRDMFAAALVILVASACRIEEQPIEEAPPAEEEVDIRTLEEPAPAPDTPRDTVLPPDRY